MSKHSFELKLEIINFRQEMSGLKNSEQNL